MTPNICFSELDDAKCTDIRKHSAYSPSFTFFQMVKITWTLPQLIFKKC